MKSRKLRRVRQRSTRLTADFQNLRTAGPGRGLNELEFNACGIFF